MKKGVYPFEKKKFVSPKSTPLGWSGKKLWFPLALTLSSYVNVGKKSDPISRNFTGKKDGEHGSKIIL